MWWKKQASEIKLAFPHSPLQLTNLDQQSG
jgi:hypothetical protein